mmetsp:Transcript_35340/g.109476  ORF Transcript_35340/g.109476 Transcript_35340/m.109476 type:complete len:196 (+) Transcript_35340:145-732(+)
MKLLLLLAPALALRGLRAPLTKPRALAVQAIAPPAVWVAGSVVAGALGTPFVVKATDDWYNDGSLKKPSWTPPDKVFAPVWTLLYASLGLAGRKAAAAGGLPTMAVAHFVGNLAWAPLFFGLKKLRAAAALQLALVGSLYAVFPAFKAAGAGNLLAPYAAWMAFATALNVDIARRNPDGVVTIADRTPSGVGSLY